MTALAHANLRFIPRARPRYTHRPMSFGLSRGRDLDPGAVGLTAADLPPLPDTILTDPAAAHLNIRAWFDHPDRPLEIEVGSGKGTFLVQQAQLQPETNFLGMEYAMEFYAYAADRIRRNHIANVRLLGLDAAEFLHWRVPSACARVIHLYFPDPWPKTKHHKRRMLNDRFLADVWRILESPTPDREGNVCGGGELRVVTDHDDYWKWMESHFDRWCIAPDEPEAQARGMSALSEHEPEAQARGTLPPSPHEGKGVAQRRVRGDSPSPAPSPLRGEDVERSETGEGFPASPKFLRLPFTRPASAGEGELVGTNFERKYRREGRPFNAAILRKL